MKNKLQLEIASFAFKGDPDMCGDITVSDIKITVEFECSEETTKSILGMYSSLLTTLQNHAAA